MIIDIENNNTANKNVFIKYSWYLKAKKIDIKFTRKLKEEVVCIILFKTNLCLKIFICAKYLLADLSFLERWRLGRGNRRTKSKKKRGKRK